MKEKKMEQGIKIYTMGGGVFSKFMVGMQRLLRDQTVKNRTLESVCFDINKEVIKTRTGGTPQAIPKGNPFDFALEQTDQSREIYCKEGYHVYQEILNSPDLSNLRFIASKIKIKDSIIKRINPEINESTLGVHIRLTDMNVKHKQYGKSTFDDYKNKIEEIIKPGQKLFVCSDNTESIEKLKKHFDVIYNDVGNRHSKEIEEDKKYSIFLRKNADKKWLWEDSFIEALSLARCGSIIYRISNLNNASVIFSSTIKEAHKL